MPMTRTPLHAWGVDHLPLPLPAGHPFPAGKSGSVRARLLAERVLRPAEVHRAEPAPLEWIALAHDAPYVDAVVTGRLAPAAIRRIGAPWSPELVARARASVYATVMAARSALDLGVAGNLAGGSHHAYRDHGEGYCVFNDIATAIAVLRAEGAARRPFIVDLDVHQGNGTAALFAGDPTVFTFSIHAARNYPHTKERGSFDLALADGTDDAAYLAALDTHLPPLLAAHHPDIVFYQSGVDGLASDRLGRLALTADGLAARDRRVFGWCRDAGLPVVVTLGGGYARPLEHSIAAHVNVWRAARAVL